MPELRPAHAAAEPLPPCAVLLCNLGTPDAPDAKALRRYLAEFLSDPRVVEIPRWAWWPILHGIVLRTRPAKSAAKYARIWSAAGSPLKVWTDKQARLLEGYLGQRGLRVTVRPAMRYGAPAIANVLSDMRAAGVQRILVLPLYPQYCAATTASVVDAVAQWAQRTRALPELRFVNGYHDDAGYIEALARRVSDHWMTHGRGDKLVMSFHGVPARTIALGDPYRDACLQTAHLLAARLTLRPAQWMVTFQSRFGKARWLEPYTDASLRALARNGVRRVDLICPGFAADCLETLEEIAIEARASYLAAGGAEFHYIECLNDQHEGMAALTAIAQRHLAGWDTRATTDDATLRVPPERAPALGPAD